MGGASLDSTGFGAGREAALAWASLAQRFPASSVLAREGAGCGSVGDVPGAWLASAPLLSIAPNPVESREAPPNSTVPLTSQRHPEKLQEVTGTCRGRGCIPGSPGESGLVLRGCSQPARPAEARLPRDPRAGRSLTPRFPRSAGADSGHLRLLPERISGPRDEQPLRREARRKGRGRELHGLAPRPGASPARCAPPPPLPPLESGAEARPGRPAGRAAGTSGVTTGRSVRGLCVPPRHVATPRALPPRASSPQGALKNSAPII